MKISINKKRFKLYLWIGLAYFLQWAIYDFIDHPDPILLRSLNELWRAVYVVAANFIFFEYILPSIKFTRKKILHSLLLIMVPVFLFSFGLYGWRYLGILLHIHTVFIPFTSVASAVTYQFTSGIQSIVFFGIIVHVYDHIQLKNATQQLRIEKQEAELNYLKSQTNPHFLFNTLNNIYSLAKDKSDLAPESILRLSQILRFMLYETGGPFIAIEQELKIISDYIDLEKLRYDDSLRISFHYDIEDMKQALPPLLLIPLVENAFKHGVSETRDHPFVDIHLSVNNRQLSFLVKNSSEALHGETNVKESIGLSNLRRQLELLYKEFELSAEQGTSDFTAALKINLASHV